MAKRKPTLKGAAKEAPKATVLTVRGPTVKTAPGELGYNHLLEPDTAFNKSVYDANVHFNPKAIKDLIGKITEGYAALLPDILEQAKEAGNDKKGNPKAPAITLSDEEIAEWVRKHVKEASDGNLSSDPYFQFKMNSSYTMKGETFQASVSAWGPQREILDLKGLKMARGSTVMVVFKMGLWASASPFSEWKILPTLRLVGLQVLKLKQWSGSGGGSVGEVSEDDLKFLDDDFAADDLSAFVSKEGPAKKTAVVNPDDMDDDLPF